MEWTTRRTWTLVFGAASKKLELLAVLLSLLLLLATTATAYEIEESSSSESTEEYEQTDSYPPVEQGRASTSDICEEEVQKWMCIDLVNSDSAVVAGPRVTDFPAVPEVKYEKLTQTVARVTHVYSEGYELMVPPNATIQVTCSQVKVRSPTFNCSHDYLMINSERFCNNKFPQAPFTFTSGNPGSQESMIVLKTANPQQASYSCQLQVIKRHPKRIIDLIKHVEFTLDVTGTTHREETDFVILAPKKSFVVMSCPVFEVSDYWPCRHSYITVELQRYCHFPTAHKVEIEIPPTSTAAINVKLASSPNDRVQCVLHRIAGKKTACVDSPNTPTYVGAPEQQAQICVNMVASPIVKIVSPFRDDMETEMDMTVRYEVMSVPHMVHYLWCNDFKLDTDCSKERLHWFNYNDRLCGHSRPRDFTYSYGSVEDKATYSLTYKKQRGVRQGHFSCFLYREPQTKGTYTLDLFSKNSATIEKHPSRRMFPHESQVITYYVLAPPDSEVVVTCSAFNIQSGQDCSNSYLKINDRQYCDTNVPGRQRLELTYNYAAVVFRDGKDASNSFSCTFERGSSTDKCAFERKQPTTTMSPFETIPTSEFPLTTTENPLFPEEGVTAVPSATTLLTPLTEETPGPWYSVGSTMLQTLKHFPNVTPEQGATVPFTPLPGETAEYPTDFTLLPQQETTRPSPPAGLFVPTTEVEAPPVTPSAPSGIIPGITGGASPPEFGTAITPLFPQENPTATFPPGASINPPTGISQLTGIPGAPTTQIPFPSQVSRLPTPFVPTFSIGVSVPVTINGTPSSAALKEITPTFPSGMSFIPTSEVPMPSSIPGQPTVIPSVSLGVSQPETGTPIMPSLPQGEVTATLPSGYTFAPTTEVPLPPNVPGQPTAIVPAVSVGVSVPETVTASPPSLPEEGTVTFPSGVSVAATTEIPLPSNIPGIPTAVVPSVSVGVSVPETATASPPSFPQEEITGTYPSGISVATTTEVSLPSGLPGQPTAIVPAVSVGVSVPETASTIPPSFPQEETGTFPSGVSIAATTEVPLPSNVPGQPTAIVPSVSVGVSVPETASPPSFSQEGIPATIPSGISIAATTEVPLPSSVPGQPTVIVPSLSVGVSVPETATASPPSFPQEGTGTFPAGVSMVSTTEASLTSGVPAKSTVFVPSLSVGVSVPETATASPPSLPQEGITGTFPSGVSSVVTTEVPLPSGITGQPTVLIPSVSVGVSVPETATASPPSFAQEGAATFPSGVSVVPTTAESLPPSGLGQSTAAVPSLSFGVSVPETATVNPSFPPQEGISGTFPSGVSIVPTTEVPPPSGVPGQPSFLPSVSVGVSAPETTTANPSYVPQEENTGTFPSAITVFPTTGLPVPSGAPGEPIAFVPSVTIGVSVPEGAPTTPPSFSQGEMTAKFPTESVGLTTEVPLHSGIPWQPTNVPSQSVGVSSPETPTSVFPYSPKEDVTGTFPSGVSALPTREVPLSSGIPGQSVPVPGTASSLPSSFPLEGATGKVPSGASVVPTTEMPLPPGVSGRPTSVSSFSTGVSIPGTATAGSPFFPHEQTAPFQPGSSGYPTTEVSLPSTVPGQPITAVPSMSVGVSAPETPTGSPSSFPIEGATGSFPSGGSVVPAAEVSLPSNVSELPGSVVPSVSVGASVPEIGVTSPSSFPQEETGIYPSEATMVPGIGTQWLPGQPTSVVPSGSLGASLPETPTTKPSSFPQRESSGTFPSGVSIIRTTEASVPSGAPVEPTNAIPSSSVVGPEPGMMTGGPSFPSGWFPTTITSGASGMTVPPGVTEMFSTGASAAPSPGESLPPGGPPAYPSAFSVIPTTEVSLASGKPGQPSFVPSVSVGVSEPQTVTASPASQPQGEEEPIATFPSVVSVQPTTEVPSVTLGVSVAEIATGTPLLRTVETRTLPGGFPVSETVPATPVSLTELSTPAYPHGITGEPETASPFMSGAPPLSSGLLPTVSGAVDVETNTETGAASLELHEATTPPSFFSVTPNTEIQSPSRPPLTPATEVPGASVPSGPIPSESAFTTPSFSGTKVSNAATSTPVPAYATGFTTPQEIISTTFPPDLINPETDEIRILLMIIRTDLKTFKVNATVLHVFLIKATTVGTHEAYSIILLALKDLKSSCKYLAPSERIKVAYEVAHYLKSHGTRIAHHVVVSAVGVFLCAVDHKDIITKLLSENTYMISISESVASELSCPDMEHLVHLLYADRNRTKVEESPCAGILCEEVPENVMDTIDMLVDRYFPQKAHEKKWLMLDIAKALNLQPEEDEDGDEMVYYKMGDYDVFLEELREPTISDEEKALLFGKYFAEVRKVAKAERKLRLDDLEEVWKMGGGKLPQPAVRSFIALLKLVHSKRISLKTEERIRLLKLALKCDTHECQKLSSSDIHNLIFALCNVGIRDGFGLPKDLKSQVTKFILTLKDNYIDSISIRRWKRSSSLLKPKSHDYLSASSPSELRYLKDWLQKPMSFIEKKPLLKNTGRSNDDPSGNGPPVLSQLYSAYVNEKRPDIKTVLAERLLDTYNSSFKNLGNGIGDTEKFVLSVVQQLPSTTARHNDLVLGILKQCIGHGDPCLNITRNEHVAPVKVILQNMSLKPSPNFVQELSHDLFAAAKKQRTDVDLSWLTDSSTARKVSQWATPPTLQMPSRAS